MEYTDIKALTEESVRKDFRENNRFICTIPYVTRGTDMTLSLTLKAVLEEINQDKLYSYLEYAQNELCMNASKANTKRIYFQQKKLNLDDPEDYQKGIATFKKDAFDNFDKYKDAHRELGYFVRIRYELTEDFLEIEILNNSPMLQEEKIRIAQRLKIARKFNSLTEVLAHGFDETEGAGYGLIVILLMLRKVNMDEKALTFQNIGESGSSQIRIPLNLISREQGDILAEEIVREIEQMPQFPENIQLLQKELGSPGCTFESVADTISSDPSLSAEILRIANSPVYRRGDPISDISGAVRMIGMLGVKSILYNYGAKKVFEKRYNAKLINEINEHAFHVALISSFLAKYKNLGKLAEDIYIAGLIHDFGKVVVSSLQSDLVKKLDHLCRDKRIPVTILDDLMDGYNHSLIGAELAEKWNFPEKFIQAIRFHHTPLEADELSQVITYAVYLGNEIYYYERKEREFHEINYMVLQFFGIEQERDFHSFMDDLKAEGLCLSL